MLRFSLWASLAAITWQVLLGYPLWYLHKAAGARAASIFAGVQLIAQGMLIVAHSIVIVVQAGVTKTWESRGRAEADRDLLLAHKATTLLLLAGGAVVTVLSPVVLRILPAQYASASVVPLLILFFLLSAICCFWGPLSTDQRTRHLFAVAAGRWGTPAPGLVGVRLGRWTRPWRRAGGRDEPGPGCDAGLDRRGAKALDRGNWLDGGGSCWDVRWGSAAVVAARWPGC